MARQVGLMLVALLAVVTLSACGKKGDPEPPNPDQVTWPRPPLVR